MSGKRGRPSKFTQKIADEICERLASGESLRAICEDEHMPVESAVRKWALDDYQGFYAQYAKARQAQALRWADEIMEISDDGTNDYMETKEGNEVVNHEHIARSRLRVDTRKWLLSKLLPKQFGDKMTLGGDAENPVIIQKVYEPPRD